MSNGERYSFGQAYSFANRMVDLLRPECERIEVAGSLRRKKRDVGDVEIVLIPKPLKVGLFGEDFFGAARISYVLLESGFQLPKNGDYYKQAYESERDIHFDIFLTTPEKWGCVFTIRTGGAFFTHKLVTSRQQKGFCPSNLGFVDGRIRYGKHILNADKKIWVFVPDKNKDPLETPEEEDVFKVLGLDWIDPEKRL